MDRLISRRVHDDRERPVDPYEAVCVNQADVTATRRRIAEGDAVVELRDTGNLAQVPEWVQRNPCE
jgi:hypothetical protein